MLRNANNALKTLAKREAEIPSRWEGNFPGGEKLMIIRNGNYHDRFTITITNEIRHNKAVNRENRLLAQRGGR